MNGTKKFYASLGMMGPLVSLIVLGLNNFVFKGTVITEADVTELVNQVTVLSGMLSAMWGRYKATKQIG